MIPLSCLHIGEGFNQKKFNGYRDWILERDNAYCCILGDVVGNSITTSVGDTYGGMRPDEQKDMAEEVLRPLAEAGKILAWVDGNHEYRTAKQVDQFIGKDLCKILGIYHVYDPNGIYLFISVGYDHGKGVKSRNVYTGFMIHGYTGSRTAGGKANAMEQMSKGIQADFYICAHAHQKMQFPTNIVLPDARTKTLRFKKRTHVMAGAFQDWEGYAIRKNYTPTPMGSPRIRFDGLRHDLHSSI